MRLYGIGGETATAILAFILDYFQKFRGKKGFKYFNYLPSCQKSEKINEPFLRKMLELMDGQAERQKDSSDFIGPSTI